MELIRLEAIDKTYHRGKIDVPVLKGASLRIVEGEIVALMGLSGSGKTTLMNTLGCFDRPTSGRHRFEGREVASLSEAERARLRNQDIGFVFQNFNLLPRTTALENVMMPLAYTQPAPSEAECRERARALLERVGLGDRLDHEPAQLSGGEQQRVAIARALVNRPRLLLADEPTGNLDSRTSEEILKIFQKLNAEEGITVVLVTHDPGVAGHARRIIRLSDGRIVDTPARIGSEGDPPPTESRDRRPQKGSGRRWMTLRDLRWTVRTAFHALRRNVLRSTLTTLGIIIGVAAVIAIMELGQGTARSIRRNIESMGANNLLIQPGTASSGGVSIGTGSKKTLTPQDAQAILDECPAIVGTAPIIRARCPVVYGNRNWIPLYAYGTTPSFLVVREWEDLKEGEPFTDQDVRNAAAVCLLGQTLVEELFRGESPVGKEVRVQNVPFRVVGVLGRKGANTMGYDQDDILIAPWTTIKYQVTGSSEASPAPGSVSPVEAARRINSNGLRFPGSQVKLYPVPSRTQLANTPTPMRFSSVDWIVSRVEDASQIRPSMEQIRVLLHQRHRLGEEEPDDFEVINMTEMNDVLEATMRLLIGLVLVVALISLVVGGVGIMNIMLVSVTERTREIGLRMAIGAQSRDILRQFLVESVVLCLLGGALGIAVGRGTCFLLWQLLRWPSEPSLPVVAVAVAVAAAIGILFGYYPAWKAARSDPIEALRCE
jgi:macrolide transport system ATP-binding/permease protein